jgi:methionyl-tRNA synthetase
MQRFYITTTLPYVNAPLHMGHALEFVRADAIARYKKLMGCEVFFNTGTDEHGSKIYLKAEEAGLSPQAFVDRGFAVFKEQVSMFGVSDDIHFIRTTDSHHIKAAQAFWMHVMDNGFIYKKNYQTKYCIGCESEKTDSELVEGKCPDHGTIPELIDEENYFFKYSAFQDLLLGFYQAHPNFIIPSFRMNEMKAFIERGLEDFSISRLKSKMPWGIPVPGDDEHVMYVWFDALTNYISTLGWPNEKGNFSNFWKNGNPTQYCGKDNTRFQGIMWQAMLMAADLPNSHQIIVNGFITGEGGIKMSKTLGNTTDPKDIVDEYGTDALRMFLLSEVSNFEDSPFTVERFKDAYNARLANGLGNLASRILTLSEKYLDVCPPIPETSIPQAFFDRFEAFDISGACGIIWDEVAALDKLIQDTQPFKTIKTDEVLGKKQITELVVRLYALARMLSPIMPQTNLNLKALIKANKKPAEPLFLRK